MCSNCIIGADWGLVVCDFGRESSVSEVGQDGISHRFANSFLRFSC